MSNRKQIEINGQAEFYGFVFDADDLERAAESAQYSQPVEERLFEAFVDLARSKDEELKKAEFDVYAGDDLMSNGKFVVGVSKELPKKLVDVLLKRLSWTPGFLRVETRTLERFGIIRWMRYEAGVAVRFGGKRRSYTDKQTGIKVVCRD